MGAKKTVEPSGFDPTGAAVDRYKLWGMVGSAGVLVAGGLFSVLAKQGADDYLSATDPKAMKDSYDKAHIYGNVALGSYIAGGAIAVTGAVLWIYSSSRGKMAIAPAVGSGGVSVYVTGGW